MKKFLILLLSLLSLLTFTACYNDSDKPNEPVIPTELKTFAELVDEDVADINAAFLNNPYQLELPKKGTKSKATIKWTYESSYISDKLYTVPLIGDEDVLTVDLKAEFSLSGETINKDFTYDIIKDNDVTISTKKNLEFNNLTDEYLIEDSNIDLLFEEDGFVPYVKVKDFIELLRGLISNDIEFTYATNGDEVTINYPYTDEDGVFYDLQLVINTVENTLYTEDPGFYYAYIESTETNYSRNIEYDKNHPLKHFDEGTGVLFDLDRYSMDVVIYEDEVVIPFYVANQLFAGSSYYNVYYNFDELNGIYAVPSSTDDAFKSIKESSKNEEKLPIDLVRHNFAYLTFVLDYFYGLKEIKNVDTYYDLLLTRANSLMSTTPSTNDSGIFTFINKTLDDLHTSFSFGGYYLNEYDEGPALTDLNQFGTRVKNFYLDGLYAIDDKIMAKWNMTSTESWAAYDEKRPKYWYADEAKTTAVVSLDGFDTTDIVEATQLDQDYVKEKLGVDSLPFETSGDFYYTLEISADGRKEVTILSRGVAKSNYQAFCGSLSGLGFTSEGDAYVKDLLVMNVFYDETLEMLFVTYAIDSSVDLGISKLPTSIYDIVLNDTAIYMEYVLRSIKAEAPDCKNIVLDLTFNSGGNVGALYRLVGFVTDEAFVVSSMDPLSQQKSTSAIVVSSPYYDETLNWALLTSKVTFSAANELVAIFKANNLGTVGGIKTSGGASSILPVVLPTGSMIIISSNNVMAIASGSNTEEDPYVYSSTEMGLEPDKAISITNIYDETSILALFE